MHYRNTGPSQFQNLENRVLFASINPADFGATPNDGKDDRTAIQAAVNAAKPGDALVFSDGKYDVNGQIMLRSGVHLQAKHALAAHLEFRVPVEGNGHGSVNSHNFAFRAKNLSDMSFVGLSVRSNNGIFFIEGSKNASITDNSFEWGHDGNYYNRLAVYASYHQDALMIERNLFHDSPNSDRNVELWGMRNSSYSYNRFDTVHDGGHIMEPTENVKLSFNHGRKIHRMGMEIQGTTPTKGLVVEGNVFSDWDRPWNDTFGLSVMMMNSPDTWIINNHIEASFSGDWGETKAGLGGPRFGLGIEAGLSGGEVFGNVVGGDHPWAAGIAVSQPNTRVSNNEFYGPAIWSHVMGEPGNRGTGSAIEKDNLRKERDSMPAKPEPRRSAKKDKLAKSETPKKSAKPAKVEAKPAPTPTPKPETSEQPHGAAPDKAAPDKAPPTEPTPAPTTEPGSDESASNGSVFLSDMEWSSASNGWGVVERDRSNGHKAANDGKTLSIHGKQYDKGLGVAVDSEIVYQLDGKHQTFFSDVGIDDDVKHKGSMTFEVWADDKRVFESPRLTGEDEATAVQVDVRNVKELRLVTTSAGDGGNSDHGDWAGARVE